MNSLSFLVDFPFTVDLSEQRYLFYMVIMGRKRFPSSSSSGKNSDIWIYGIHAVCAALKNPRRKKIRLLVRDPQLLESLPALPGDIQPEIAEKNLFQELFGRDTVHQGIALLTSPLPPATLEERDGKWPENSLIVLLDEITDPHNAGAILRSAAAFGASAVIMTNHNAPPEDSGILAKTACGALEEIPVIRVMNLARTIKQLREQGFWVYGLDERGKTHIGKTHLSGRIALIMGAEGEGMRRLTRENCDALVALPTLPSFGTLNVSASAAVALYEWKRQQNPEVMQCP